MSKKKYSIRITILMVILQILLPFNPVGGYKSFIVQDDTWFSESTPKNEGVDGDLLQEMVDVIYSFNNNVSNSNKFNSVIIIKNNKVILEEYPNSFYSKNTLHHIFSVTKSFTSALIGIAIEQGYIDSIEEKIVDIFPEKTFDNMNAQKANISIKHCLTMTTGLEWDEDTYPSTDPRNDFYQYELSLDPVSYVFDKPMISEPGEVLHYNSGVSTVLSAILTRKTGQTTLEYAVENLFEPLNVSSHYWSTDSAGYYKGGTQLYITPRTMAKFGNLYLNNGSWNGEQLVPALWVNESTQVHIIGSPGHFEGGEYGYHWWVQSQFNGYYASGSQGQTIAVLPDEDCVIVFTGKFTEYTPINSNYLIIEYILPALDYTEIRNESFSFEFLSIVSLGVIISFKRKKRNEKNHKIF